MQDEHSRAWAEALLQEQAHQRELLATFRGELGAFARECGATLTALDAYVGGISGLVQALDVARTGYRHADLLLDVARRLSHTGDGELYEQLGEDANLEPRLVERARELVRAAPRRTDRELLIAVVDAAGIRARVETLVGPAPLAALTALRPLAGRLPALATIDAAENETGRTELTRLLDETAQLATAEGLGGVADAVALGQSLRDAHEHARGAARAVEEGRLEQVVAEARRILEADLENLGRVLDGAPDGWRAERRTELDELTEEVSEKVERIERTRRALVAFLPQLQAVVRALAAVERLQAVEGRVDGRLRSAAEAARNVVLLGAGSVWDAAVPKGLAPAPTPLPRPRRSPDKRVLVAAALVVLALVGGGLILVAVGGGKASAPVVAAAVPTKNTVTAVVKAPVAAPAVAPAVAPRLSPVHATFVEAQRATFYAISVAAPGPVTYAWRLSPPAGNPTCTKFARVPGSPNKAVWHHADTDGCAHTGFQHDGTVTVTVTTKDWNCTATFFGTLTKSGPPARRCTRA